MEKTKILLSIIIAGGIIGLAFVASRNTEETDSRGVATDVATQKTPESISVAEFREKIENNDVVVIDVRTPEEYESGYIGGAINLDFYDTDFGSKLDKLDKSKSYAIYCRTGNRSGKVRTAMKERGIADAVDLRGGITAWLASDLAVECTSGKVCLR